MERKALHVSYVAGSDTWFRSKTLLFVSLLSLTKDSLKIELQTLANKSSRTMDPCFPEKTQKHCKEQGKEA